MKTITRLGAGSKVGVECCIVAISGVGLPYVITVSARPKVSSVVVWARTPLSERSESRLFVD